MAESPSGPRAKRQRVDKVGRFAALEKLRQLKGHKHKYEVQEEVDSVYEIVDEREYAKKAREKYGVDWIEEDGTGYAEDGRDFFEDEDDYSDEESADVGNGKKGGKKTGKKRGREDDKPVKGKGSLRNLFSNAMPKKATITSLKDDDILADILGELDEKPSTSVRSTKLIAPVKIVSATATKQTAAVAKEYMNNFMQNSKVKTVEKAKNVAQRVLQPKIIENNTTEIAVAEAAKSIQSTAIVKEVVKEQKSCSEEKAEKVVDTIEEIDAAQFDDNIDFNCLQEEENQFEMESEKTPTVTSEKNTMNMENLLQNWEKICQMEDFEEEVAAAATEAESTLPKDSLRFWYWEAWEDAIKRPGEVFLFGRTADGKSVCVHVEQVERVLYLLPREHLLDPITKENTKQKVTAADLYKEFDSDIANELKLSDFRSRKVNKHFANHAMHIDVPFVCDYMEVRYDGRKPAPNIKKKYNSIAHIFGAQTPALERFLLERKIKGPCWLTLKQFKVNSSPISWCKMDITVSDPKYIQLSADSGPAQAPPTLNLLTLNICTALNHKTMKQEICLISMLTHKRFPIDRPAPQPAFTAHQCGLTRPSTVNWPFDLNNKLTQFKATRICKHDNERALLSWFLAQYQQIDPDLIVTYDALDCQLDILADRVIALKITQWSRLGRLRMSQHFGKKTLDFFVGRMLCDVKRSAEECIRARSYDLQSLCQQILKLKENERIDLNNEDVLELYEKSDGVFKLITLTMQDASYILRLMCELNIMPLALQITNICGNTMTRTLQGGRSERNEFLLLHAFTEKNYIVPDKKVRQWRVDKESEAINSSSILADDTLQEDSTSAPATTATTTTRKKAAYAGGLVLEPIRGLYDKFILLMDFNSLYPSIIQEYNICFTTVQQPYSSEELPELPESGLDPGILPQQLRRLVESRREVKKLMAASDITPEQKMQYHIRQMALKLTANSMYGCLGFAHSRFFAQHLAALVTHKGREILMNTKSLVEKLNYEVVYGDTDSIMVNTNNTDYDQVLRIGHNIKQNVNKLYKQLELDIDGVFSCLLLLKKKKYAAVKLWKNAKGELQREQEHKGLDIVRRDWSQLAVMLGKLVLDEVLAEKTLDEKIDALQAHLEKVSKEVRENLVPLTLYIITKQLSKAPTEFTNATVQAHVQVALRMNKERQRRYKKGDMVDYVICKDGSTNAATQRAYHLDELKDNEKLSIDADYYLAHQIHPVITRMVDVLEGLDASRIAEWLGLDPSKFRAAAQRAHQENAEGNIGESAVKTAQQKYRQCDKFTFICVTCKAENRVASAFRPSSEPGATANKSVLSNCVNPDCETAPYLYVISIRNQLVLAMRTFIKRFYNNWLVCDDPGCNYNTRSYSHVSIGNRPVCVQCKNGSLIRQYTERDLYIQLDYFKYMFDLSKHQQKSAVTALSAELESAYNILREAVEQQLEKSAYCCISLEKLFVSMRLAAEPIKNIKADESTTVQVATSLTDI